MCGTMQRSILHWVGDTAPLPRWICGRHGTFAAGMHSLNLQPPPLINHPSGPRYSVHFLTSPLFDLTSRNAIVVHHHGGCG